MTVAEPSPHTNSRRYFGLDVVRAIAIALVVMGHYSIFFIHLPSIGPWLVPLAGIPLYLGVELFFALSGWLIGAILLKAPPTDPAALGNFWMRRWVRTVPLYALFVAYLTIVQGGSWFSIPFYLTFTQHAGVAIPDALSFDVSWSLCVEEWFYLLVPLALYAMRTTKRTFGRNVLILWIALLAIRWLVSPDWADFGWVKGRTTLRLDAIMAGVVAVSYLRDAGFAKRIASFAVGSLGLAAASYITYAHPEVRSERWFIDVGMPAVSACCALLLPAASLWREAPHNSLLSSAVTVGAAISYPLYLVHYEFSRAYTPIAAAQNGLVGSLGVAVTALAASVALSWLLHVGFELPLLRWRDRVFPATPRFPLTVDTVIKP